MAGTHEVLMEVSPPAIQKKLPVYCLETGRAEQSCPNGMLFIYSFILNVFLRISQAPTLAR